MKFQALRIPGAFAIEPERIEDERGFFARTFSREEFVARGLCGDFSQSSISFNRLRGTLRGLHFQSPPHEEAKLVRCSRGAIRDVIVDLRRDSPAFERWAAIDLSAVDANALYVPQGCAHGFLTLEDESEVLYQMSNPFHAESAAGVRWNDPAFAIDWRDAVRVISERDRTYPDFVR
jgi:dTDP-4-dehydrorhamnose 3,5-epimerase